MLERDREPVHRTVTSLVATAPSAFAFVRRRVDGYREFCVCTVPIRPSASPSVDLPTNQNQKRMAKCPDLNGYDAPVTG